MGSCIITKVSKTSSIGCIWFPIPLCAPWSIHHHCQNSLTVMIFLTQNKIWPTICTEVVLYLVDTGFFADIYDLHNSTQRKEKVVWSLSIIQRQRWVITLIDYKNRTHTHTCRLSFDSMWVFVRLWIRELSAWGWCSKNKKSSKIHGQMCTHCHPCSGVPSLIQKQNVLIYKPIVLKTLSGQLTI